MEISQMLVSDLEKIQNTLTIDFDDFWTYSCFQTELKNPNSIYFVAKDENNNILGFAGIWQAVDIMHVMNIVVKKDLRKQGIASKLLEKLIETSLSKQVTALTLEVNANNIAAQKLYEKYKFETVGTRKKYYNGKDDANIMTLFFN